MTFVNGSSIEVFGCRSDSGAQTRVQGSCNNAQTVSRRHICDVDGRSRVHARMFWDSICQGGSFNNSIDLVMRSFDWLAWPIESMSKLTNHRSACACEDWLTWCCANHIDQSWLSLMSMRARAVNGQCMTKLNECGLASIALMVRLNSFNYCLILINLTELQSVGLTKRFLTVFLITLCTMCREWLNQVFS